MKLCNETFIQYAMRHYENPGCKSVDDFNNDVLRFKYVKRLLNRYVEDSSSVNFRLILNHIIILYNIFEQDACTAMLFFKLDPPHWEIIKPILGKLNYLPDVVLDLGINTLSIPSNPSIELEIENAFTK
jgi:hypothetical protein